MQFVKIDPPGTWCHYAAIMDLIRRCEGKSFLEVGCGAGDLSLKLCRAGYSGTGVDFSAAALEQAGTNLSSFIQSGQFRLVQGDIRTLVDENLKVDLGLSMMVMEHVEDDRGFVQKLSQFVRPKGFVILAVPGRRDRWGIEDETVGHFRRYDREDLRQTLLAAGLEDVKVWSVAVPVANLLFSLSNLMVRRSKEVEKVTSSMKEQTETSGIREIPFKTVFPSWCRIILNRVTLSPAFFLQCLFYNSGLGLTMLGAGRVPE